MERQDRGQVDEVYTISQVADLTGVPENTIRSWERRFGIPRPARSESNQRRYFQRDIEAIRSIQSARERGRTMEQAIAEVSPVIVSPAVRDDGDAVVAFPPTGSVPPALPVVADLIDALVGFDETTAAMIVSNLAWSSCVEDVCLDLLLPAGREVRDARTGERMAAAGLRFAEHWILRKLQSALDHSTPETGRLDVAVAAMHDEETLFEALCVAIVLSRAGFRVIWLGGTARASEIGNAVDLARPDAMILTGLGVRSEIAMTATIEQLAARQSSGAWSGVIATAGEGAAGHHDTLRLSLDREAMVSTLLTSLNAREGAIRLVRKP
jgi:hypothetical protein